MMRGGGKRVLRRAETYMREWTGEVSTRKLLTMQSRGRDMGGGGGMN